MSIWWYKKINIAVGFLSLSLMSFPLTTYFMHKVCDGGKQIISIVAIEMILSPKDLMMKWSFLQKNYSFDKVGSLFFYS